jgi:hypothetical protein
MYESNTGPPGRRRSGAKIAALVASGLIGLLALALLATAGGLLWGDSRKDAQGYLSTDTERFTTDTHAIATNNLDVDLDGVDPIVDGALGKVRVKVTSNEDKPAFVGIARTDQVARYLRDAPHAVVDDIDSSPFAADYRTLEGDHRPDSPAEQRFWEASARGTGTQTLTWDLEDGQWSVVVMNADASPGVDAGISAGAMVSWLDDAGWILAGTGTLLLVLAGGLLYAGVRPGRPGQRPEEPNPSAPRSLVPSASTASSSGIQ